MGKAMVVLTFFLLLMGYASAGDIVITINLVSEQGIGKEIGTVTASDSPYGLILTPRLSELPPGLHGFHLHEKPDCAHAMKEGKAIAGLSAGGHFDPASTGRHEGPFGTGHLGDLPALYAGSDGKTVLPVLAPRLKTADIKGRSLMIHGGGDNYSDTPAPLGGGGARIACGVIP